MKRVGIHLRLLIAVFAIIGATTFALGYMGISITREFVQSRFEERINFLARYLARNAELGILLNDRAMLKRLASNLLTESDVIRVAIVNARGEVFAEAERDYSGELSSVEHPVIIKESEEETKAFQYGILNLIEEPLIGTVRITYSTEGIRQLVAIISARFIAIAGSLGLIAAVAFYFLSHSLVAPIMELGLTARKVAQGDLDVRAHTGTLPETMELATAFNAMLDSLSENRLALERANRDILKRNMLTEMVKFSLMVAHEVKNPLSIIKSSLDLLKNEHAIPANDMLLCYINDEIRRLNRIIEDFLTFARPAQPIFRFVDVSAFVREIIGRYEIQTQQSGVSLQCCVPTDSSDIKMDPDLMTRAVDNIMRNAIESLNGKGSVLVTVRTDDAGAAIDISDDGEGIKADPVDKVFEPFFTTRSKGTGLGLAYSVQVVRSHGGTIKASNRMEGGACFTIELPRDPECIMKTAARSQ
ncbi:MAG: HAMP domain-containing protein [Deltaproteobacteria bacterium]|nr:HAMP domain-containing protein [Deltaproteobacteria bacterium]